MQMHYISSYNYFYLEFNGFIASLERVHDAFFTFGLKKLIKNKNSILQNICYIIYNDRFKEAKYFKNIFKQARALASAPHSCSYHHRRLRYFDCFRLAHSIHADHWSHLLSSDICNFHRRVEIYLLTFDSN